MKSRAVPTLEVVEADRQVGRVAVFHMDHRGSSAGAGLWNMEAGEGNGVGD